MIEIIYYIGIIVYIISLNAFILNQGKNLIMIVICLELILFSLSIIFLSLSFLYHDMIGTSLSLFILPLAGGESAVILAILIRYFPIRGNLAFSR